MALNETGECPEGQKATQGGCRGKGAERMYLRDIIRAAESAWKKPSDLLPA